MQIVHAKTLSIALASAALVFAAGGMAYADEPLPGVDPGKSIVQPMPEPLDDDNRTSEKQPIKVGDWDVRMSGSIIIDIGAGSFKEPRR